MCSRLNQSRISMELCYYTSSSSVFQKKKKTQSGRLQFKDRILEIRHLFPRKTLWNFFSRRRDGSDSRPERWSRGVTLHRCVMWSQISCHKPTQHTEALILNILKCWKKPPKMLIIMISPYFWAVGGERFSVCIYVNRDNMAEWLRANNTRSDLASHKHKKRHHPPSTFPPQLKVSHTAASEWTRSWPDISVFPRQIKPFNRRKTLTGCLQPSGSSLG